MSKWHLINISFSLYLWILFKAQDIDSKENVYHPQLYPDSLFHHKGNPVPLPFCPKPSALEHPPSPSSFWFNFEETRTQVRWQDPISTWTGGNALECPLGGTLSTGLRRPTRRFHGKQQNFWKDMNLDGKIPIDPIFGLPDEHAGLFLIRFYPKLYILPKEKVTCNRGSRSWEIPCWEMSQPGAALRQSPALPMTLSHPPGARSCGAAGDGSQHLVRLASEGERAERPSVANPTCPGGANGQAHFRTGFLYLL